ncbi:MAG: S-layer homology domain-containing protein, partial [Synergistaceae bacterium]|nr:S-layer homology domain-containing protein [Synergistaceae bacterium]
DMEKASKQDLEMLKKLVMEFKDELDALGVKVDGIDKRVAVLEDRLGGWKLRGLFVFDAAFGGGDNQGAYTNRGQNNEFRKEKFRLFLSKQIDENTSFYAQYRTGAYSFGAAGGLGEKNTSSKWSHLYVDTKLAYDVAFRVGRFANDFEGDYGLYNDADAMFGDYRLDGFQFKKSWGMLNATAIIGRNTARDSRAGVTFTDETRYQFEADATGAYMNYILDLNFQPNEKFFVGATGYWMHGDGDVTATWLTGDFDNPVKVTENRAAQDFNTYGIYAGFHFNPAVSLKGIYYFQQLDWLRGGGDDPKAWKVMLDVKQDLLKFTSLWIEYAQEDNNFFAGPDRYNLDTSSNPTIRANRPINTNSAKYIFVKADQKWNDKWNTFLRYAYADFDTAGVADGTEWGAGVGYQYNPAMKFQLMYDNVDNGNNNTDHVVLFRTSVSF